MIFFDNIRFPQLRIHCSYYKNTFAFRSECPEIISKNLFWYLKDFYFKSIFFYAGWVSRQKFSTATSLTQPLAHYSDDPRGHVDF